MKLKLLFLALLLPVLALVLILIATFFLQDFSVSATTDLTYIIVIVLSIKICDVHFKKGKWFFDAKQVLTSFLLAVVLFGCFYIEKVLIGNNTKGSFSGYQILSSVVMVPIMEEFFSKRILLDNLKKLLNNRLWVILIIAFYFSILHFPTFIITHFIFGLATAYLYYTNKSLFQVILIHALYNALIVLFNIY